MGATTPGSAEGRSRSPRRAPVRMAHLGLGAFHRSHQAWYTHAANEASGGSPWGIAAFTGRSAAAARILAAQDCRYTLLVRGPDRDDAVPVGSIVRAHDGADAPTWRSVLATPGTGVVTLTVTEAGYRRAPDGHLALDAPAVRADVELLSRTLGGSLTPAGPVTAPGRLLDGLGARRAAGAGPIAVVSCDNLPGNGAVVRTVVHELARLVDPDLAAWIDQQVSFVSSVVDRITPATTLEDLRIVRGLVGWDDRAAVVAEPYREWILSGPFPGGRPAWELAGAGFVDDLRPYEQRKLWLLNAGHSLLAYAGLPAGDATIAGAFADPALRRRVEELWAEAREVLRMDADDVDAFLAALRARWANRRIEHHLAQIAADGFHKLPVRVLDVAAARARAGLPPGTAGPFVVAAWIRWLLERDGASTGDPGARPLVRRIAGRPPAEQAREAVAALRPDLPDGAAYAAAVAGHLA